MFRRHARPEDVAFVASLIRREMPVVEAPASIWTAIEEGSRVPGFQGSKVPGFQGSKVPGFQGSRVPGFQGSKVRLALAALLIVALVPVLWWQVNRDTAAWDVVRLDIPGSERMNVGEWVETDATSRARIKIGAIGTVDVEPNTRMQLLTARPDEHRLNLAHGMISAQILAPPRLFFVETPSSTVVDLGCAYTMQVDQAGVGELRVTSGWASLEWGGRESIVPAGASCPTRPEVGPGTPAFDDSSDRLRQALLSFDEDGGVQAVDIVLAEARGRDTLTLWHLLSRVDARERPRIFDRMAALTPLPPNVTREKALALDPDTLKLWREELAWTW
jgi:hypothetical protein